MGRKVLEIQLPGKGKRRRLKRMYLDEAQAGGKMKCLTEVYGESAVAIPDGKGERRRLCHNEGVHSS